MVFSSLFFLYLFLPLMLIAYYVAKPRYRNVVLIVCSLIFYAWGEPVFIWLLLMSTLLNYLFGRLISADPESRTAKISVALSLIFHIGMLVLFKYTGFLVENLNALFSTDIPVPNLPLPIGISFYTFRAISYIVDCYWGKVEAEQKFSHFLLYMTFFPVVTQGPIARYETMQSQLSTRRCAPSDIYEGMMRVIIGLGKKVILADNLGNIVDQFLAEGNIAHQTTLGAWYGVVVYALQIYFDFSGYSDIAIGISRMLGFRLEENFRHPFLCKDITEFWQRWHISLGTFFRDYVLYIPIFGKRRKYGGLFLVWFCTGLWHGASWNFILWGLYYGLFILIEQLIGKKRMKKIPLVIRHIYNKLVIVLGFGIFYFEDLGELGTCLKCMFGFGGNGITDAVLQTSIVTNLFLLILALFCCFPLLESPKRVMQKSPGAYLTLSVCGTVLAGIILLVASILLVNATNRPFLYLRF